MPFGYNDNILHVDLTHQELTVEHPGDDFYRTYMGGSAIGLYYLLKFYKSGTDAFDPDNPLVIALSVITGAPVPGLSRLTITAKSPLTNAIGDSQSGGFFPAELKFSGFDAIVIRGKAQEPVYLWIHDGDFELRPAKHLWGKVTGEVEDRLRGEIEDNRIQVLQCGPAGENRVRFASIMSMVNRANGRTGMGAVMASKNLKAIAVRGHKKPYYADKETVLRMAKWGVANFEDSDIYSMGLLGTAEIISHQQSAGGLPSYNYQSGVFEGYEALDGKTIADTILKNRDTCYACCVRCKRVIEAGNKDFAIDPTYGGPEYESLASLGSYCGISDLSLVAYANQLCNMYGLDTISCGATIAWAMDCYSNGILSKGDVDGLDLHFGNAQVLPQIITKIVRREGIGNILAEGSARAAEIIGKGSDQLLTTVKKQELPAHMPQVKPSLGLIYAVNPFGADHQSSAHEPTYENYADRMIKIGLTNPDFAIALNDEKVRFAYTTQLLYSALDSLNVCQFVFGPAWQLFDTDQLVSVVRAISGWEVDIAELKLVGERRLNMMRIYNAREGFTRDDDLLPPKLYKALVDGASDGAFINPNEIETAKDLYYELAGWDTISGNPKRDTLQRLGLDQFM